MPKHLIASLLGICIALPCELTTSRRSIAASPSENTNSGHLLSTAANRADRLRLQIVAIATGSTQGSGVIIQRRGRTYTILTAAHVVNNLGSSPVNIITPDRQQYPIDPRAVKLAPNRIDLATITFESDREYVVAALGNSQILTKGQPILAIGFRGKSLKFYPGTMVAIGRQAHDRGYGLAIGGAEILPGMSGGGLFDEVGSLVGINGKSIGTIDPVSIKVVRVNRVKPVSGLAISIDTFVQIASQLNLDLGTKLPALSTSLPTADDFFITAGNKSQQGDYHGAIADYDRTLAMNPQFSEVYFRRAIARTLLKDWQGAEADYTRAIAIEPRYPEAYLHRGSVRNSLTNWRGAKSDFDAVIALDPYSSSAHVGRGVALCALDRCRSGLQDYDRAIALNRSDADAHSRRGFAHYRLGNRKNAIDSYITAAELYRQQGKDRDYLETVEKIRQLVRG